MYLTKHTGERVKAYRSLDEAIKAVGFDSDERYDEKLVSLGIGRGSDGVLWYAAGREDDFKNCMYSDLKDWWYWFIPEWIEKEE